MKQEVLIITYNQKVFLEECIQSILTNSMLPWRISIFDDCSTDGTKELVLKYMEAFPDLFFFHESPSNLGIYGNQSRAYLGASGDVIHPIGGDDFFGPNFFEEVENSYLSLASDLTDKNFIIVPSYSFFLHDSGKVRLDNRSVVHGMLTPRFSDFVRDKIRHRGMGLSRQLCKHFSHFSSDNYLWADRYMHLVSCLDVDFLVGCPDAHTYYRIGVGVTSKHLKSRIWLSRLYVMTKLLLDYWEDPRVRSIYVYWDIIKSILLFFVLRVFETFHFSNVKSK